MVNDYSAQLYQERYGLNAFNIFPLYTLITLQATLIKSKTQSSMNVERHSS